MPISTYELHTFFQVHCSKFKPNPKNQRYAIKQKSHRQKSTGFSFWKGITNLNPFEFLTYVFELLHIFSDIVPLAQ